MLLEDVPLLMPKTLINQFVFIWGCEHALQQRVNLHAQFITT
jgi:hypothetical protein